ncbi:MAG: GxxExxY protein [Patescibacteria group bacterium]
MSTNYTNKNTNSDEKLIYPDLSYILTGIFFDIHNKYGRFAREKQYCDLIEQKLKDLKIDYNREHGIGDGNIIDFLIDSKIILEIKAKRLVEKEDFYQLQRYLQFSKKRLGLIVNFRNRYIKPVRIVRIDTDARRKFN